MYTAICCSRQKRLLQLWRITLLFPLLLLAGCSGPDTAPVRVAHTNWPGYETLALAVQQKAYPDLEVIDFRFVSAIDAISAFEHHHVDVAALTLDEALLLQSRSPEPLTIIAVMDISHGGDAIIAHQAISSMPALKGKRVGVETSALGAYFLTLALEQSADISLDQIEIVPLRYNRHYDAFVSGRVDAVVTYEPVRSQLLRQGGRNIFDSTQVAGAIVDVLVTRQTFANAHPKSLKRLLRGHFTMLDAVKSNPDKYIPIMARLEGIQPDECKISLSGITIPDVSTNHAMLGTSKPSLTAALTRVRQFMSDHLVASSTTLTLTTEFLPAPHHD